MPQRFQRRRRALPPATEYDFTLADQRQGHMGERRQVTTGAHRAAPGDNRMHAMVQECAKRFGNEGPHAGKTARQRVGAQQQQAARLRRAQRFTHAAGVAADHIQLQFASRRRVNVFGGKTSHAGGDAIDHLLFGDDLLHPGARFLHRHARAGG